MTLRVGVVGLGQMSAGIAAHAAPATAAAMTRRPINPRPPPGPGRRQALPQC